MTEGLRRHSVSIAAVVVDDSGHILVTQRRDNGRWEPPGGVLELGESIIDGLKREVLEETGLEIDPSKLTGIYQNMARGVVALVFRARVIGGTARTSIETSGIEWWTPEMVAERMVPAYAVRVIDGLREDDPPVRAHDGVSLLQNFATLPR